MVIKRYITEKLLNGKPFVSFLNKNTTKHSLFHCYQNMRCCSCQRKIKSNTQSYNITYTQLKKLYDYDSNKKNKSHTIFFDKRIIPVCICSYTAVKTIEVKDLDITLAICVINAAIKPSGIDQWIKQISEIKNKLFLLSDSKQISSDQFAASWKMVASTIIGISKPIGIEYAKSVESKILQLFQYSLKDDACFHLENLCYVYSDTKFVELEVNLVLNDIFLDSILFCSDGRKQIET